jgi:threonine aldolase
MCFLAAQLDAYLEGDLWLENARHANRLAAELARGLSAIKAVRLEHPVEANELFVTLPEPVIRGLEADGFRFYRWMDDNSTTLRLVTSFETDPAHVAAFVASARRHAAAAA